MLLSMVHIRASAFSGVDSSAGEYLQVVDFVMVRMFTIEKSDGEKKKH